MVDCDGERKSTVKRALLPVSIKPNELAGEVRDRMPVRCFHPVPPGAHVYLS